MNREQARATLAHQDVQRIADRDEAEQRRYATVVYQAIVLIRTAGLVQALEFLNALSNTAKQAMAQEFIDQLARHAKRVSSEIQNGKGLRDFAREHASLHQYMLLTRELMAALVWYRRFVQSVLKVDPSDREE